MCLFSFGKSFILLFQFYQNCKWGNNANFVEGKKGNIKTSLLAAGKPASNPTNEEVSGPQPSEAVSEAAGSFPQSKFVLANE